ncbi:MAG: hypothetical protein WAW42_12685 [Candidatus Competibacteraceae bacterium]
MVGKTLDGALRDAYRAQPDPDRTVLPYIDHHLVYEVTLMGQLFVDPSAQTVTPYSAQQ